MRLTPYTCLDAPDASLEPRASILADVSSLVADLFNRHLAVEGISLLLKGSRCQAHLVARLAKPSTHMRRFINFLVAHMRRFINFVVAHMRRFINFLVAHGLVAQSAGGACVQEARRRGGE